MAPAALTHDDLDGTLAEHFTDGRDFYRIYLPGKKAFLAKPVHGENKAGCKLLCRL
jgi:hypothetical protein